MHRAPLERVVFYGVAAIIGFLVVYPVGMMIGGTFLSKSGSFTLEHWSDLKGLVLLWEVLKNTLIVTTSATMIAIVIGVFLAFLVSRTDIPMSQSFEFISIVPFITPPIIAGLAWQLLAEKQSGLLNIMLGAMGIDWRFDVMTIVGVTLVSALYLIPFVFLITSGVMRSINPDLEEASVVTGAGKITTFIRITMPLLMPGLTSAALLAFMYSNILFGIHATLGMPKNIWFLTTAIYQSLSVVPTEINRAAILSCILMVFGMLATYMQIRILAGEQGYETLTGKGFRAKLIPLGRWRWVAWGICTFYVFVVIILPYLVLFLRSMKPFMFVPGMSWADAFTGWQFDKYMLVLTGEDPLLVASIWHSFILAFSGGVIALMLTSVAAYVITKTDIWGRETLNFLCMVPFTLPGIVLGVAILWGYTQPAVMLYGTIWILLVAYVTKDLPLGLKSMHSSFLQVHSELEESSRVCGASWRQQFTSITLPLVKPGIVIGFVLTFASILREVGASILLYSQGNEVIAYVLWNLWENGENQTLTAFIMLTTLLTLVVVVVILKVGRLKFVELTRTEVTQS
jgi:iron(III) transport system permease protein